MKDKKSADYRCGMLDPDDCVLVVIDVQEKLLPVMREKDRLLDNVVRLVRFAKIIGLPLVVTEQENLGPTVGGIASNIEDLCPIMKIEFDAGRRAEFIGTLEELGRGTIIMCGIESHVCITQTVLSLLPRYTVHVVGDAVSSRAKENREISLERMRQSGAVISSTEMVIFELLQRAGTPEFKETLKLVK